MCHVKAILTKKSRAKPARPKKGATVRYKGNLKNR